MIILYIVSTILCLLTLLANLHFGNPKVSTGFALVYAVVSFIPFVNTLLAVLVMAIAWNMAKAEVGK